MKQLVIKGYPGMKSKLLIWILFSLLVILMGRSDVEAQQECQGITQVEMLRFDNGDYVAPLNEFTLQNNCVTFTGFPVYPKNLI